jgi:hypothetical protein
VVLKAGGGIAAALEKAASLWIGAALIARTTFAFKSITRFGLSLCLSPDQNGFTITMITMMIIITVGTSLIIRK